VKFKKTTYLVCEEDRDEDFEVQPESQIFDVLSSDDEGNVGIGGGGISAIN
jgi:hypothetical protein